MAGFTIKCSNFKHRLATNSVTNSVRVCLDHGSLKTSKPLPACDSWMAVVGDVLAAQGVCLSVCGGCLSYALGRRSQSYQIKSNQPPRLAPGILTLYVNVCMCPVSSQLWASSRWRMIFRGRCLLGKDVFSKEVRWMWAAADGDVGYK